MDKIFGEVDAVEAGEDVGEGEKVEALAYSHQEHEDKKGHMVATADDKKDLSENVDTKV